MFEKLFAFLSLHKQDDFSQGLLLHCYIPLVIGKSICLEHEKHITEAFRIGLDLGVRRLV